MYQILTDIKMLDRFDLEAEEVVTSGYQGSWVTISGGKAVLSSAANGEKLAYPVWTEEYRDGTQGFSPDTAQTSKVTCVSGKHRAYTDRFDHTSKPDVGDYLYAGVGTTAVIGSDDATGSAINGMLMKNSNGIDSDGVLPVAVCKKAPFLYTPVHGGTARYVIEIQVLY